jgi:hypothetical protein
MDLRPWNSEQWREHWTSLALGMWTGMRKAMARGDREVARLCIGQAVSAEGLGNLDNAISTAMRVEERDWLKGAPKPKPGRPEPAQRSLFG